MKDNFVHICFIVDESGSMYNSISDVLGGFEKVLDEHKSETSGSCAISFYKFNQEVTEIYKGKDIKDVKPLTRKDYSPGGCTAMFDGIGTAIDNIGKWLSDMPEYERPEKNIIVIMTDGEENSSSKYDMSKVKEMIKEQETKYNWSFVYLGTDINTTSYADTLGISYQGYTTRENISKNYAFISSLASCVRCCSSDNLEDTIATGLSNMNSEYFDETGLDMNNKNDDNLYFS